MKSRYRILGLCLMAVFALGAVASATASAAAPEFVRCAKVSAGEPSEWGNATCTGKTEAEGFAKVIAGPGTCVRVTPGGEAFLGEPSSWEDAACTKAKAGYGGYIKVAAEWKPKFTSTSFTSYLFAGNLDTITISCAKDKGTGEITGEKTVGNVTVSFKECRGVKSTKAGTEECPVKSVGALGGEIVTKVLGGEIGPVAAAEAPSSERGLDLKPTTGHTLFDVIGSPTTCVPESNVEGSVIGEVEPGKLMETTGELIFGVKGRQKNKQTIQKFEGGLNDTLEAFELTTGFESTDALTFAEALEVT